MTTAKQAKKPTTVQLKLGEVVEDQSVKVRAELDEATVQRYEALYRRGEELPDILVYEVDGKHILCDGAHRKEGKLRAEDRNNDATINAQIKKAEDDSYNEIFVAAIRGNRNHGLPLSTSDRNRIIQQLDYTKQYTQAEIAEIVGCSQPTVSNVLNPEGVRAREERKAEQIINSNATPPVEAPGEAEDPDLDAPLHPGFDKPERAPRSPRERAYDTLRRPTAGEVPPPDSGPETGDFVSESELESPFTGKTGSIREREEETEDQETDSLTFATAPDEAFVASNLEALSSDTLTEFIAFKVEVFSAYGTIPEAIERLKNLIRIHMVTEEGNYGVIITDHSGDCSEENCGKHALR